MKKTVIKAQRALNQNNRILIYNEERSIFQELENDQTLSLAIGDRLKCYFEVSINQDGLMSLIREVKANW